MRLTETYRVHPLFCGLAFQVSGTLDVCRGRLVLLFASNIPTALLLLILFSFCWINRSQCEPNIKSQLIESASPRWKQFVWCVFLDSCLWRSEWTWEDLGSLLGHSWHLSCQDPEDCYSKPMKRLGISQSTGGWIMLKVECCFLGGSHWHQFQFLGWATQPEVAAEVMAFRTLITSILYTFLSANTRRIKCMSKYQVTNAKFDRT